MKLSKSEISLLEDFVYKASGISNMLYNIAQHSEHWTAAQASIKEFDESKIGVRQLLSELNDSLLDANALQAWKDANMPTPRETWIAGYLAAKSVTTDGGSHG